jgi:hypothetical protein
VAKERPLTPKRYCLVRGKQALEMLDQITTSMDTNINQRIQRDLLNDLDAEIMADARLSEAEKQFLLTELPLLSDENCVPVTCIGEAVAETIIQDRGPR